MKHNFLILFLLFLTGCAANVSRHGYQIDPKKQIAECSTPIKLRADLSNSDVQKLGMIDVYDANLVSANCDESIVLGILKNDSCQLGADLINITKERQPDYIFSVCYQVKADFIKFKTPPSSGMLVSDPQYDWAKVQERGAASKQKGTRAYAIAVGAGVGGAVGAGIGGAVGAAGAGAATAAAAGVAGVDGAPASH